MNETDTPRGSAMTAQPSSPRDTSVKFLSKVSFRRGLRRAGVPFCCFLLAALLCAAEGLAQSGGVELAQRTPEPSGSANVFSQGKPGGDAREIFAEGKAALLAGRLAEAERDFQRVIALDETSAPAHTNLAVVYMRERRWEDALAELHRAEILRPDDPGIELNIGLANYRNNEFASAIPAFRDSLQHAPGSLQARYLLGLCYFFTDQYKDAASTLEPLWSHESSQLNYLYVLSIAASKASNADLQKRAFSQMLVIGQNSPEFHLYLGKAWLAEDDTSKALAEFLLAAHGQPDLPLVHYFLGRTYLEQHAYADAAKELMQDAALEPEFAYNYEDLGLLYAQTGKPALAEEYFKKAVALNHSLVNSYFGLAKLYRDAGRWKEALPMLDAAERLAPQSASLHYMRGQVLARLGEQARAREEFAKSADLLHRFNDRLQQGAAGDEAADAQRAAEQ